MGRSIDESERERKSVCISFSSCLNAAWLLTVVYLFFDVSNTIIKDFFLNSSTPYGVFFSTSQHLLLLNLAIQKSSTNPAAAAAVCAHMG